MVSEGRASHLKAQQASWARVSGANALFSSPAPPGRPLTPASSASLASLLCPQDQCDRDGALQWGYWLGSSEAPWPKWARRSSSTPLPLFPESPSLLPFLIYPASGVLILSGLHFSYPISPPTSYQFTLGFFPSSWASESPHQWPAGALVVGRL